MSTHDPVAASDILNFTYGTQPVRTILKEGEPWWVASDVCDILGLQNSRNTLATRLDDDEKGVYSIYTPGGTQEVTMVNEPGLYSLILGSKKPEAKAFKRWITHEVIPSIRKTGSYQTKKPMTLVQHIEAMLEVAKRQEEYEARLSGVQHQVQQIQFQSQSQGVAQEKRIEQAERTADAALAQSQSNYGYYTVLGFTKKYGIQLAQNEGISHGLKLGNMCRRLGAKVKKVPDARFGSVNMYPEEIMKVYFQSQGLLVS